MRCNDIDECIRQINAYFNGTCTGHAFIFDTEDLNVKNEIIQRLEADKTKKCCYVSESCQNNELPNIDYCITMISNSGDYVLIGASQALMLRSEEDLEQFVDTILEKSISGHALIILNYCKHFIEKFQNRDPRITKRTLIYEGDESPIPTIALLMEDSVSMPNTFIGVDRLLAYLERLTASQLKNDMVLNLQTRFNKPFFARSMYPISEAAGPYENLIHSYSDMAGATKKSYGTIKQWYWLYEKMKHKQGLSELVYDELGTSSQMELILQDVVEENDSNKHWLYWLYMKAYGVRDRYLQEVLRNTEKDTELENSIYLTLANMDSNSPDFEICFLSRKKYVERIPEDLMLTKEYCDKVGKYEKKEVFYLLDNSQNERYEFIKCLSMYDYTENELYNVAKHFSTDIECYLRQFVFDNTNTKVATDDIELREVLSQYFQEYKVQKLTNKIFPFFEEMVNEFALERPYNKLRPRSSIVSQLDKENSELFFFDALGVEYLSYIKCKCDEYGLIMELSIGHCELPSITIKNKEFLQYFGGKHRKIDELDEVKHNSQIYDYEKCKLPIHIFRELEIIDNELRNIQAMLIQESIGKAIIVSDHGASRLAVISGEENPAFVEMDEKGEHSGRYCPVDDNPNIKYAAYEDGYAVLANYERFKGGRKANVEVHGGATLEEVIVPIITLTKKPSNVEYCFTESLIILKQREIAALTLYCNVPMNKPRLCINNKFYEGEFVGDKKHAKFSMPEIKRSRKYTADVYEGDKNLSVTLEFTIQKSTGQEIDLFA